MWLRVKHRLCGFEPAVLTTAADFHRTEGGFILFAHCHILADIGERKH
jgi:hypothetical protein